MPPPKKRPRTKVALDIKNLKLDDVMCPVCRSVIIEPVSLPCEHSLCYFCFDKTIENNTLTCPVCRKRIGGWLRTATKSKSLINQQFWLEIQKQFPNEVKCKQAGEDDGVEDNVIGCKMVASISNPGEIGLEFKEQLEQFSVIEREEREKQEKAGAELAKKLMEEELKEKAEWLSSQQKVVEKDAELAKSLALEENKEKILENGLASIISNEGTSKDLNVIDGPSCSGASKFKSSASSTSSNSSRCNSIDEEFRHFTPILPNRNSKNKPQKSGPPTISSCVQFFKNVELVRPIKPDHPLQPETAFEKPQGPHRLHVLKHDKSNAFQRLRRNSQDDSSDTDYEEDDSTRMASEDGEKMVYGGNKMAKEGNKMAAEENEIVVEGNKMVTEGNKMVADGNEVVMKGNKMAAEGNKMAVDGNEMMVEGLRMNAEGSELVAEEMKMATVGITMENNGNMMMEDPSKMAAGGLEMVMAGGSDMVSGGTKMVVEGSKMAAEGYQMATDGSNLAAGGSKMAAEGTKMAAEGSKMAAEGLEMVMAAEETKMTAEGSRAVKVGGSIFADESDDVTRIYQRQTTSRGDMETTSAVVKSVLFDEVSIISHVTADVGDVEKIYSELEKRTMERIRQEEEDRKFALQMQEMWEKDEQERARHVTSDYKLRRKQPATLKRTVTPKGTVVTVPRQTTLDKHVHQVRS